MSSSLTLNGIHLDALPGGFVWPLYRGTSARGIVLTQGSKRFDDLSASLQYSGNTLTFTAPNAPGIHTSTRSVVVQNVYCERFARIDDYHVEAILFDARYQLSRLICPFDYNVKLGDEYLTGTAPDSRAPATVGFVVEQIAQALQCTILAIDGTGNEVLPDGLLLAGLPLTRALDLILEPLDLDLTVGTDGLMRIVRRKQRHTSAGFPLPHYAWVIRPMVDAGSRITKAAPSEIRVPYLRKRQLVARIVNDQSAAANDPLADFLAGNLQFEQVYEQAGGFVTYDQLIADTPIAHKTRAEFEKIVAEHWASKSWHGSGLPLTLPTTHPPTPNEVDAQKAAARIIPIIKRDWRQLFRLKLSPEMQGFFQDYRLGTLQADGHLKPEGTVVCAWFEALAYLISDDSMAPFGLAASQNHSESENCPLIAVWVSPEHLVFRIGLGNADGASHISWALPGAAQEQIGLKLSHASQSMSSTYIGVHLFELGTFDQIQFVPDTDITVRCTALQFGPNAPDRYHIETIATGLSGGDAIELSVSEHITANFTADDTTKPMNHEQLREDATRRAKIVARAYAEDYEAVGLAHGVALADDFGWPQGKIFELSLEFHRLADWFVGTHIAFKDASNHQAAIATQMRREAVYQTRNHAGKAVS